MTRGRKKKMKKKDFEEMGFGREKGENPLKLQENVHLGGIWGKTKSKASKNKAKTTPPKKQVIGEQQQQQKQQKLEHKQKQEQ